MTRWKRFGETFFSKGETEYRKMVNSQKYGCLANGWEKERNSKVYKEKKNEGKAKMKKKKKNRDNKKAKECLHFQTVMYFCRETEQEELLFLLFFFCLVTFLNCTLVLYFVIIKFHHRFLNLTHPLQEPPP